MILIETEVPNVRQRVAGRRVCDTGRAEGGARRPGLAARLRGVEAQRARAYAIAAVAIPALWWVAVRLSWALWWVTR